MALTRKMLKAMGIDEEKIDQIIEAHAESTDALKQQRDEFKEKAEGLDDARKKLKAAEAKVAELEEGDGFEAKYNEEHKAFEAYKAEVQGKEAKAEKEKLFRELLEGEKVEPKRIEKIVKYADFKAIDVEDGKLKDAGKLLESTKAEWEDYFPDISSDGAPVPTPPTGGGGDTDLGKLSMKDYIEARKKA